MSTIKIDLGTTSKKELLALSVMLATMADAADQTAGALNVVVHEQKEAELKPEPNTEEKVEEPKKAPRTRKSRAKKAEAPAEKVEAPAEKAEEAAEKVEAPAEKGAEVDFTALRGEIKLMVIAKAKTKRDEIVAALKEHGSDSVGNLKDANLDGFFTALKAI